jgi:predicted ABC-type ATPase
MPWFWIVAGPNGSGKSTFVDAGVAQRQAGVKLRLLNADIRTAEILAAEQDAPDANLRAAIEIDAEVAACIGRGDDFLVETVFSSDKYLDDIEDAKRCGYLIGMTYVCLASPMDSILRVGVRHSLGGHDVPADRIVARWERSIAILGRALPWIDELRVFDNSGSGPPILIAVKRGGVLTLLAPGRIPALDAVLLSAGAVRP